MGDLASAIVDLGRFSERRRDARRQFRDATAVVLQEMLRLLRVGDEIRFRDPDAGATGQVDRLFRVERVTWPVEQTQPVFVDPDGLTEDGTPFEPIFDYPKPKSTLVCYDRLLFFEPDRPMSGAVLLDVREPFIEVRVVAADGRMATNPDEPLHNLKVTCPVVGRTVSRVPGADEQGTYLTELHLATDGDLLNFADDALEIAESFAAQFDYHAKRFRGATDAIARLAPK